MLSQRCFPGLLRDSSIRATPAVTKTADPPPIGLILLPALDLPGPRMVALVLCRVRRGSAPSLFAEGLECTGTACRERVRRATRMIRHSPKAAWAQPD